MYKLIRPLLFKIDSETAHNGMLTMGSFLSAIGFQNVLRPIFNFQHAALEAKIFGINFKNPVGPAAGFDKAGRLVDFLPALGFSHVEVGDISFLPWQGNPKPRLFRLPQDHALINRMGQNNKGAEAIASILQNRKFEVPVMLSLVKTPDPNIMGDMGTQDFVNCFRRLYPLGDLSVINVSCPNTAEGKTFEEPQALTTLLDQIMIIRSQFNLQKPVLVKISPDVDFNQLDTILEICEKRNIDGYILTNTSKSRENLKTNKAVLDKIGKGGLSGPPIRQKATELIRHAYQQLKRPCLIGLGGIDSAESAYERIKAGASLVQIYSGLIYEGPGLVKKINQGLVKLLERDGFKNITEAVGIEAK